MGVMKDIAKGIIANATKEVEMDPLPNYSYRPTTSKVRNVIFLEKEVPADLIVSVEMRLDFWNEISGFFHANMKEHEIVSFLDNPTDSVEIPDDVKICRCWNEKYNMGDYIVTPDYTVWFVHGYKCNR